jgi:hypothetical protein
VELNKKGVALLEKLGKSREEIEQVAKEKVAKEAFSGARQTIKGYIKEFCLLCSVKGVTEISPRQVFAYAFQHKDYKAKDCKGIADATGAAHNGLYLMQTRKEKGQKFYKIPNPDEFSDWYAGEVPLPEEYYGDAFNTFISSELTKPKSTFFDGR